MLLVDIQTLRYPWPMNASSAAAKPLMRKLHLQNRAQVLAYAGSLSRSREADRSSRQAAEK